jgi:5'-phosphate synthase pdxT subunit
MSEVHDAPVGLLALQGDFALHRALLDSIGIASRMVRRPGDLDGCRGLILPGGETTTMHRLLRSSGLLPAILDFAGARPVLGTCAGAILMATRITDAGGVAPLGLLEMTVQRNAYGRQVDSFEGELALLDGGFGAATAGAEGLAAAAALPARGAFIRAPRILEVGPKLQVLALHQQQPVAVRGGRHLALTFHPEVNEDPRWHRLWLQGP